MWVLFRNLDIKHFCIKKWTMASSFIIFLFTSILIISPLNSEEFPSPVGFVNDFAGVMDEVSKTRITEIAQALKDATGAEIAVVTVDTIAPYSSIEEYSIELATKWGIGKRGEDTGILFLLSIQERKVRLEVGYGLEGIIPDGLAGQIIDRSVLPSFKEGLYGTGLLKGVEAVAGIIAKEYNVDLSKYNLAESRKYTEGGIPNLGLLIFIILILLFGGWRFILWPLLFLGAASHRGFYGGGFGTRGGSGFGGGFSGFGGGGFGGGGASRGF